MRRTKNDMREQKIAQAEALAKRQYDQIKGIQPIVSDFNGPFWKAVVERLHVRIRKRQAERSERFESMTEVELKVNIARELELKDVISLPEDVKAMLESMQAENAALRDRIREWKARSKL